MRSCPSDGGWIVPGRYSAVPVVSSFNAYSDADARSATATHAVAGAQGYLPRVAASEVVGQPVTGKEIFAFGKERERRFGLAFAKTCAIACLPDGKAGSG